MSTIVFENPGEIDLLSICTFGVSVKESENPIGFFGTGLKYAIAVLLRTGHQVSAFSGLRRVEFGLREKTVRGTSFDFVTMTTDDETRDIGFTTELGKQWEIWMAYREIACNCKDEGGEARQVIALPLPEAGRTMFAVTGDAFARVHQERAFYILEDEPHLQIGTLEVRRRPGRSFYYRGVRVHAFSSPGLYTYNDSSSIELTEDRTVKDQWVPGHRIAMAVLRCDDESFIRDCVLADENTLEGSLDYHGWGVRPSKAFLAVVGECMQDRLTNINPSAMKVWKEHAKQRFEPLEVGLTAVQLKSLNRALDFCERLGFRIRGAYPIKVVESLGEGTLGLAQDQTIFIAERVFTLGGTKQLASTLIEEFVHLRHGWKDMTRELQNFLFDKLVSVGEELVGEPL